MGNKAPIGKFIEYFSKQLNLSQIEYLNQINHVTPEKVELYRDFIISLGHIIHDTYLGDDIITDDDIILIHFNWCWEFNIDNFIKERINFKKNGEHYYYYLNYFVEMYYKNKDKNYHLINEIISFWENVFSITRLKTKSEYDIFIEAYKTQDKYFFKPT
jgi:hypothetical protein